MRKIFLIVGLLLCFLSPFTLAKSNISITLQCNINFSNYDGIDHATTSRSITLNAIKHIENGSKLVAQTDGYEFWVMIHGVQKLNGVDFINTFQVAIKQKSSGLFVHALSDFNTSPNSQPTQARVSLVSYHPNTFLESGELLFECKQ